MLMITLERFIRLAHTGCESERVERMTVKGFECGACGGYGYVERLAPEHPGHDTLGFVRQECEVCHGTGQVDARVTIEWTKI